MSLTSKASCGDSIAEMQSTILRWRANPVQFVTEIFRATPDDWQAKALQDLADHDKVSIRSGHGVGKDLEESTGVLTPYGWRPIGELQRGDEVFAVDGTVCRVMRTWHWQDRDLYRVTLADGGHVTTGADHEWYTETRSERRHSQPGKIRTTRQVMDTLTFPNGPRAGLNHRIPTCGPVQHPTADLPIDPYALGVWLGDGSKGTGAYTKPDESVAANVMEVAGHLPVASGRRTIVGMSQALRLLGLLTKNSHERFIPEVYRFADSSQRHSLLQGLLDTDGTCSKNSAVTYDTSSLALADGVSELVRSLGGVVRRSGRQGRCNGENKRWSYRVYIAMPPEFPPFRGKKGERWRPDWQHRNKQRTLSRFIESVERVGKGNTCCIAVSHPSRLYITRDHIVTHNSTLDSWSILWFLTCYFPAKVPCTAPTMHQLKDILWSELTWWHREMPAALRNQFAVRSSDQDMRVYLKSSPDASFAVARTGRKDNPDALQGFHSDNLLFVIDEASGIDEVIFEVAQGALSTPHSKVLMTANPTRTSGYFYNSHHGMRHRWATHRVSCLDSPRVSQQYIDDVKAQYGEDSNVYRVRVLGEFPRSEDDVVIPLYLMEDAIVREVEPSEAFRPVWGLDVARFGDDRTALAKRRGNALLEPVKSWHGADTMETVGRVVQMYRYEEPDLRPGEILVDVIGIGAGVVDRLQELGLPARGVNVGESPTSEGFVRLRDQLWWFARQWFEDRSCTIVEDDALISELSEVKYKIGSNSKIQIESKQEMKERGHKSPDLADAFVLTFAGGLELNEMADMDRYQRQLYRSRRQTRNWRTA